MADTCEVALPVPLRHTFTYAVPDALKEKIVPGARVIVPFGNRRLTGVVLERNSRTAETQQKLKDIAEAPDAVLLRMLTPKPLVELGNWVAGYYLAPVGETFRAMLPPAAAWRAPRMQKIVALRVEELSQPPAVAQDSTGVVAARKASAKEQQKHEAVRRVLTERGPLPLTQLQKLAAVTRKLIERMVQQGSLQVWEEPIEPHVSVLDADFVPPANILNDEQQRAFSEIQAWLAASSFRVGLLYGITGSGKTEVYLRAVAETLARGRTALVLVPEIALTLRVGRLCRALFREGVAVLHSGLSDQERAREWWQVRHGQARVVVGTRSAVFAPLENVGLVIVDEEQESSYKQEESPRYQGRDVAIYRAKLEGAVALLGSATPSLESFHHARTGKYELLRLDARVANRPLAPVQIVDLREDFRHTHNAGPVSERLRAAIAERLAGGTQSLVLINRRGYSWFALCRSCGSSILCENCSIALAYHRKRDRLVCHYCGFSRQPPKKCPKCSSEHIYFVGAGAEQLEERLRALFPAARIARLDRDTAQSRRAFEQVLEAFADREIDILVGTQMVAKGHDFHGVTLVGVVSADAQLGFPDFRAAERTFQLLTQVAGRAGRGDLPGEVLVETHYPEHYAIQLAARQDYPSFFEKELHFRRMMHYPPFTSLALLLVRDPNLDRAVRWSRQIGEFLQPMESRGIKVLGSGSGAAGAAQARASLPVFAEVAAARGAQSRSGGLRGLQ